MCVCVCVCVQVYSLCANSSIAVDVFGSALQPLVSAPPSFNITFIGKGDPGLCSSIVQAVFNLTNCSSSGDNCAGPRYIAPPVQGEYVVRGGGGGRCGGDVVMVWREYVVRGRGVVMVQGEYVVRWGVVMVWEGW